MNTTFTNVDDLRAFDEVFGIEQTVDLGDGGFVTGDSSHAVVSFIKDGLHVSVNFSVKVREDAFSSPLLDAVIELATLVESRM